MSEVAVRVIVADADHGSRADLVRTLNADRRITVVAEVAEVAELFAPRGAVDVIVLEARLPDRDGTRSLHALCGRPDCPPVAILADFDLDDHVIAAIQAGARAFLLKDASQESLIRAVLDVAAGGAVADPRIMARWLPRLRAVGRQPREAGLVLGLSLRERQVLQLLADGWPNAAIGARLGLTEATVKSYVSTVLTKLGVTNRVQAALLAHRLSTSD